MADFDILKSLKLLFAMSSSSSTTSSSQSSTSSSESDSENEEEPYEAQGQSENAPPLTVQVANNTGTWGIRECKLKISKVLTIVD